MNVLIFEKRTGGILSIEQRRALALALRHRLIALCFGAGVDSTAMMVALHEAGIRPDLITFADTGGEKSLTMAHLEKMQEVMRRWGWPAIVVCKKIPLAKTGYSDLFGNCMANETLPSLAFGMKSCSLKWKSGPQDQLIKGAKSGPNACDPHPVWVRAQAEGQRIVKLIGYDCGKADMRRSKAIVPADSSFDYSYPLQLIGWNRALCIAAITKALGADYVPIKSACFFCPASKQWELFWLAAHEPQLLEEALLMERNALTGRHSRFDVVEFGASWEQLVNTADRFPSSSTTVGLGRSFAWNQWARVNGVVDADFKVKRGRKVIFMRRADELRGSDNALDRRAA